MFEKEKLINRSARQSFILFSLMLAIILTMGVAQLLSAQESGSGATPSQSPVITSTLTLDQKLDEYIQNHIIPGDVPAPVVTELEDLPTVIAADYEVDLLMDMTQAALPGDTITYVLTLSNTGVLSDVYGITAVADWTYTISPTDTFNLEGGSEMTLTVAVQVPGDAVDGASDTAVITATSQTDNAVTDSVELTTLVAFQKIFMPVIFKPVPPPPTPSLSATRPNSANDWQMNWTISDGTYVTGYTLQQSQDPTFATGVTTYNPSSGTLNQLINSVQPTANNEYYFRMRALGTGGNSNWSNVVKVIGAYYDDFTSNQTGWSGPTLKEGLRRLTYIEKTDSWYENGEWLIIRVEDSWDWLIASPLKPAPALPYVIEYRSKVANLGNLVSHGVVFGGDWNGAPCPDWTTYGGVYYHKNCFNHFYNGNIIWSSDHDLTLLWERIDELVWCPNCGGSPLKRLGFTKAIGINTNASDWNDYRIEVRSNSINYYLNGALKYTYNDTRWVNDPYFGVFASADEYSNSTWRFEYFRITPLDN